MVRVRALQPQPVPHQLVVHRQFRPHFAHRECRLVRKQAQIGQQTVTAVDMRGFGTYNMPPGTWSDDSSMTLASLVSLNESRRKGDFRL